MNESYMVEMLPTRDPESVSREDFERFLVALTHDIRNKLNGIALEAADLAEQAGPPADAVRLQQYVQECSAFLKKIREALAPDDPNAEKMELLDFVKKLRERQYDA
jgi:signal transduction histidine kinase